jgi:hypothetical protein
MLSRSRCHLRGSLTVMVAATLAAMVMVGLLWPALPARAQAAQPSFAPATNFAVGTSPIEVTKADFNSDGRLDLAVTNQNSDNVSVLLGDGKGGFGEAQNFIVGNTPFGLTSADFNGDRKSDLTVANGQDDNVSVLLNTTPFGGKHHRHRHH